MIFKLVFIIFILFIIKLFIIRFDFNDYFFVLISIILSFFSFIYIISDEKIYIVFIIILSISLIINSYLKTDSSDNIIIVLDGKINFKNMIKKKYSISSFYNDLKDNMTIFNDNTCILLKDNKLESYIKKDSIDEPIPIIIDGLLHNNGLLTIEKSNIWLNKILNKYNYNIQDIFYSFFYNNKLYIIKK